MALSLPAPRLGLLFASLLAVPVCASTACTTEGGDAATFAERSDAATETASPADGGGDAGSEGVSPAAVSSSLAASGFTVQEGKFAFLDMTACCASTCAGNNPSSPYAAFYVPPAPGAPPDEMADAEGLSTAFRLRADEAVVFVGPTPPEVRYFGFTPYLYDRAKPDGARRIVAASLSETLNNLVIGVAAPATAPVFGRSTAIIAAADATTRQKAEQALVAAGVPLGAINTLVFDPAQGRFGVDESADRFSVLARVALPTDPAALASWTAAPGASLYRLTPATAEPPSPLPSPVARAKDSTNTEAALTDAVNRLRAAIVLAYPDFDALDVEVDDGVTDPQGCIDGTGVCAFDNRDTTYPATRPRVLFAKDDDFYVAYGVDHQVAGKVRYANVSVYALEHLVGLESAASPSYPGSALRFLGADPEASKLYAWKIARTCEGETACMTVEKGACPSGIENGEIGSIVFRTYVEPSTKTAPLPSTLVRDRILRLRRK